jgi:type III pantothenate kinase
LNLLLDIGNTNLRWASQEGPYLGDLATVRHGGGVPLDLIAAWEVLEVPCRVLVANVGGEPVAAAVGRVVRALWGVEAELVAVRAYCLGLRVAYEDPSRLGVDRWLALLAAQGHDAGSTLIVDAGTAVTYDLLLDGGRHLGGLILPGMEMMRGALLQGTWIPPMGLDRAIALPLAEPWGTDTGTAVAAGGAQALGALADRLYDRLAERCAQGSESGADDAAPRLLLTGGDAERLAPAIGRPFQILPDLVLRGLARLAEEHC